jgi:hypothetical protein
VAKEMIGQLGDFSGGRRRILCGWWLGVHRRLISTRGRSCSNSAIIRPAFRIFRGTAREIS